MKSRPGSSASASASALALALARVHGRLQSWLSSSPSRAGSSAFARAAAQLLVGVAAAVPIGASAWAAEAAPPPTPNDFAYGMKFETTGTAAAFVSDLPAEVYRGVVRPDLADMAVFNGRGEVVPHVLRLPRTQSTLQQSPVAFPVYPIRGSDGKAMDAVRVRIEAAGAKIDVQVPPGTAVNAPGAAPNAITSYVLDGRALGTAIAAFVIGWPDDAPEFAGRLRVEGSDDLGYWQTLVEGAPVANLRAGESRLVERRVETRSMRSRFWRLSWVGGQAPFEITSVTAEPAGNKQDIGRPSLSVQGTAVVGKAGEFEFDLAAHLPVDRVNVELPEVNSVVEVEILSRQSPTAPWSAVTRNGFYRLQSATAELVNGEVSIAPVPDRYWLARVDVRGNGLGSGKPKLHVAWPPHEVLFLARGGGPYTLAFGNASVAAANGRIPALPQGAPVLRAPLGKRETLGGEARLTATASTFPSKSTILWTVLGLGVALLAYMAYRLGRELKR